jgi:hypothetical protein
VLSVSHALKHASLAVEPKKVITPSIIITSVTPTANADTPLNIEDIISIEKDVVIKKLLANEASLLIKTNNSIYKVIYIKDIDKVIESLDSIIKVGD